MPKLSTIKSVSNLNYPINQQNLQTSNLLLSTMESYSFNKYVILWVFKSLKDGNLSVSQILCQFLKSKRFKPLKLTRNLAYKLYA